MRDVTRPENIVSHMSDLIGRTPLLELGSIGTGTRLLLKLEQFNPTGSAKTRMARAMVDTAEQAGHLAPGGHIIEPTSGNTGLGLALAALERGYRFTAVVDHHAAKDKLRALAAMGTHLVYVSGDTSGGPQSVRRRQVAREMAAAEPGAHWLDQHNHPGNSVGYAELARELLADIFGDVDYLVSSVGTGGALCGTARELRRYGSHVRTIGVEPAGSIIFGGAAGKYHQSGGGSPEGFPVGTNVEHSLIDEGTSATDVDAFATARVLARRTGLLVGGTAGGAIHVALNRLGGLPDHSTVVALVCDAGEKYLDTIYDDDWMRARGLLSPSAEEHVEHLLDECAGARAGQAAMSGTGAM